MTDNVRSYRASAAEGASHMDLLLSVYDALAEDIRLAGDAAVRGDIPARCRQSQRAFVLLGCLESWISLLNEPALEENLARFYAYIRSELVRLQSVSEGKQFAELAMQVCETRAAWQQRKSQAATTVSVGPEVNPTREDDTPARLCWSA